MAQDIDMPTPEDKGKGKAAEGSKDEKPVANGGKKEEEQDGGWWTRPCARLGAPC